MSNQKSQQRIVGHDWVQITDGKTNGIIQVYATVEICRSPTKPASHAPCLQYERQTITLFAPDIVWVRSPHHYNVIINIW